jgi:hypothetical protein
MITLKKLKNKKIIKGKRINMMHPLISKILVQKGARNFKISKRKI